MKTKQLVTLMQLCSNLGKWAHLRFLVAPCPLKPSIAELRARRSVKALNNNSWAKLLSIIAKLKRFLKSYYFDLIYFHSIYL